MLRSDLSLGTDSDTAASQRDELLSKAARKSRCARNEMSIEGDHKPNPNLALALALAGPLDDVFAGPRREFYSSYIWFKTKDLCTSPPHL
jgi:hypothetical protein